MNLADLKELLQQELTNRIELERLYDSSVLKHGGEKLINAAKVEMIRAILAKIPPQKGNPSPLIDTGGDES